MKTTSRTLLLCLIFFNLPKTVLCQQSEFDKGYRIGYAKGYCYTTDKSALFCTPPVFIPNAPWPVYPENSESFNHGYNRGFIDGGNKRDQEDRSRISKNTVTYDVPKFTPYVPQNPLSTLTLEQYFQYRRMQEYRQQQLAQGIAGLIEAITYKSPAEQIRIAEENSRRELERLAAQAQKSAMIEQKRLSRANEREAKKLIIGSEKYLKNKKDWKRLLGAIIITSSAGFFCMQKGNSIFYEYRYATENATNLRKTGNLLYMAGPAFFITSGYFALKFSGKSHKLITAKKPY
jgi:hypothetical protein